VIWWGRVYARNTFVLDPLGEGFLRTANWIGFQAALVIPALPLLRDYRLAAWTLLMLASALLGERYFPRYYFALLPPLVLAASRTKWRTLMLLLLLIPAARFGPRYALLAMNEPWRDLALYEQSSAAAAWLNAQARPGETILVWGYRPEINVLTRMKLGSPYLESQPLNGVFADRHLTQSAGVEPEFVAAQQRRFAAYQPDWVADGLGPLNPKLRFAREGYELVHALPTVNLYRRRP
jgi:hypothetical protein